MWFPLKVILELIPGRSIISFKSVGLIDTRMSTSLVIPVKSSVLIRAISLLSALNSFACMLDVSKFNVELEQQM